MARDQQDREDLIAEATGLVTRMEFTVPSFDGPIVIGWKRNRAFSIYLDQDPVYQFDAIFRLRRAYVKTRLYRSQGETIAELTRHQTPNQTILARIDLDLLSCAEFLQTMTSTLRSILQDISQNRFAMVAWISADNLSPDQILNSLTLALRAIVDNPSLSPALR